MLSDVREDALKRLSYIEGHLKGIRRMVESDQYCVDVLKQTYAVEKALQALDAVVLRGHLRSCVAEGMRDGRQEQVIEELAQLYELSRR